MLEKAWTWRRDRCKSNELAKQLALRHEAVDTISRLKLTPGEYVVVGGAAMKLRGIKDTPDIDIIVSDDLYEKMRCKGFWREKSSTPTDAGALAVHGRAKFGKVAAVRRWLEKNCGFTYEYDDGYNDGLSLGLGPVRLYKGWQDDKYNADSASLISEAEFIDGIQALPLGRIVEWKQAVGREKDLADIELIQQWTGE